ncbi:MAG TPA: histidine kinase dimerization/phosphoacceptor domain -containing protein, partial [Rhizobacter sp.]|nr:histidine kinase dimerization/phosphoacceptor domain -containing protein [Rhizobacter sp.]
MRIRAQLIASTVLAGLVAILVAAGLWYATRQAEAGLNEQADSEQVAQHVANMLSLTNEFTLYGGERAVAQWRSRHEQLQAAVVRAIERRTPPSPALVELQRSIGDLSPLFDKLVQIGRQPVDPLAQRRQDLLLERLLAETQAVLENRHRWSVAIGQAQQGDQRLYAAMVLAAPAALLLLLISLGILVGRRVLKPLAHLQATVTNIREGNLGARCDTGARDELGDAARAIDSMTTTLQRQGESLATSNASLSREITGRRDSEERLRLVADNLPALVSYLDRDQRFRFANRAYRDWLGTEPDALIGRGLAEVYGEETYVSIRPHMEAALAGGTVTYERELATPVGMRHVQVTLVPQRDGEGSVQGLVTTIQDITERRLVEVERVARQAELESSLREKEILLQEIHHRVKNNLQVISSLLQLQAGYAEDDAARKVFEESQGRIKSMALVHEKLYQTHDLAHIDFGDYLRDLVSGLAGSYATHAAQVAVEVQATSVLLDVDRAIPCGLIVNELVSNCFKHG